MSDNGNRQPKMSKVPVREHRGVPPETSDPGTTGHDASGTGRARAHDPADADDAADGPDDRHLAEMRAQLEKINPQLLTDQERPMYEYLRILQGQLERMQTMMDTMMQQPGMHR